LRLKIRFGIHLAQISVDWQSAALQLATLNGYGARLFENRYVTPWSGNPWPA
jgi:hypothetical protein